MCVGTRLRARPTALELDLVIDRKLAAKTVNDEDRPIAFAAQQPEVTERPFAILRRIAADAGIDQHECVDEETQSTGRRNDCGGWVAVATRTEAFASLTEAFNLRARWVPSFRYYQQPTGVETVHKVCG